ncbi:MAG: M81 family metallopeptidase, partial [Alphaproteobacteria bacterium]
MARIAVGGFQHETNTFVPFGAGFAEFETADGWPPLTRGADLFAEVAGINIPIAGFVDAARADGHELVPLLWCSAEPSGPVRKDAFERITAMLCEDLAARRPFDAVYLDLHGAMVSEHLEDGEGELLKRVRAVVGRDTPVVVSLDFHANVTEAMAARATALLAYRTYPHVDMAETGARAARLLARLLGQRGEPARALKKVPFLIPVTAQCTEVEPTRSLQELAAAREEGEVLSLAFTPGFPPADIAACGPAVVAYATSEAAADRAAAAAYRQILAHEGDFQAPILEPDDAVRRAIANRSSRPVVLADTQDNPGGGGSSDTVGILEALVRHRAERAVVAVLCDPEVVAQAASAGEGALIDARLGGKSGIAGDAAFVGRFLIEKLADGRFTCTGPVYRGSRARIGPMALLRVAAPGAANVHVIVSSLRFQAADQAIFHHMGLEPAHERVLVLKSSVHFRADF